MTIQEQIDEVNRLVRSWEQNRYRDRQRIQTGMPRNEGSTGPPSMNRNRSRRQVLEAQERRNAMSVATTFGRLHGTMCYLINTHGNETVRSVAELRAMQENFRNIRSAEVNLELIAEMMESSIQFAQARENGLIIRSGASSWSSRIPRTPELNEYSAGIRWFADEFDEAAAAQLTVHILEPIKECLLLIASELVFWGLGRVVRLASIPRSLRGSSRGVRDLFRAARQRLVGASTELRGAAARLANILTGGQRGVPISLCPRTGQTMRGIGPLREFGRLPPESVQLFRGIGALRNLGRTPILPPAPVGPVRWVGAAEDIGRAPTIPQDIGRAPTLTQGMGRAPTLTLDMGRAQTLTQDIGRAPTLTHGAGRRTIPDDVGRASTFPDDPFNASTPPARTPARGQALARSVQPESSAAFSPGRIRGSNGIEIEPLTADAAQRVDDLIWHSGYMPAEGRPRRTESVSSTWGSSPLMVESYTAKWTQFGMSGMPPPHGFRVYQDDTLIQVIVHFSEQPPFR